MNSEIRMWDNWYYSLSESDRSALIAALPHHPQAVKSLKESESCFVLGYLNSDRRYYDGELGPNQHHFNSRVGTALTSDFESLVVLSNEAFSALDYECSIWSGSFARGGLNANGAREYLFFIPFAIRRALTRYHNASVSL